MALHQPRVAYIHALSYCCHTMIVFQSQCTLNFMMGFNCMILASDLEWIAPQCLEWLCLHGTGSLNGASGIQSRCVHLCCGELGHDILDRSPLDLIKPSALQLPEVCRGPSTQALSHQVTHL
jgi:hypothetical protein